MAEKEASSPARVDDMDLEAAAGEKETKLSREQSPTASTKTEVEDEMGVAYHQQHSKRKQSEKAHASRNSSDGYVTDETDHGEPDLEHEEAEETVPGRELDRQLSRVCTTHRVSP